MRKTTRKLTTRFCAETRFELQPLPPAPFRATQETDFEKLKNRLLTETLLATGKPELNATIRRAANEAAALSWVTLYPMLLFPALFDEKIRLAFRQAQRQAHIYAKSPALVTAG
jgi:hypothetical protein